LIFHLNKKCCDDDELWLLFCCQKEEVFKWGSVLCLFIIPSGLHLSI
jgi:hypothetical protein